MWPEHELHDSSTQEMQEMADNKADVEMKSWTIETVEIITG